MADKREISKWDGHKLDKRLVLHSWEGHGERAFFTLSHRDDFGVEYDSFKEYCWLPVVLRNGRMMSGVVYAFLSSSDCVDAIENGEWNASNLNN